MNCPINEQAADGVSVGRCYMNLTGLNNCPRHGDVSNEVLHFLATGKGTLENVMRKRKGLKLLGEDK